MWNKSTSQLMNELNELNGTDRLQEFLEENKAEMDAVSFCDYLNELVRRTGLKKIEIIKRSQVNEVYAYQIFSGKRMPGREKVVAMALAMSLSLDEIQRLLKLAGLAVLYPKNARDCIFINAINSKQTVSQLNQSLIDNSQPCLNSNK